MKKEKKEWIKHISCYLLEKLYRDFEIFESLQEKDKNALIKDAEKALNKYDEALRKLNAWASMRINCRNLRQNKNRENTLTENCKHPKEIVVNIFLFYDAKALSATTVKLQLRSSLISTIKRDGYVLLSNKNYQENQSHNESSETIAEYWHRKASSRYPVEALLRERSIDPLELKHLSPLMRDRLIKELSHNPAILKKFPCQGVVQLLTFYKGSEIG